MAQHHWGARRVAWRGKARQGGRGMRAPRAAALGAKPPLRPRTGSPRGMGVLAEAAEAAVGQATGIAAQPHDRRRELDALAVEVARL
eukprot:CAMPEP_0175305312 /NCGR_PEP_ID=MMETSP0093-20121207/63681_1 /TAXON_ID=311494 /ORGANISM="Alexandrium monilatum, Strain CCMP3105" /LENGTH=86 /DNA_ID=CAMNT_0016601739 /DNA_START=83 /DNA_END=340 /DNA_ORIENTATION=-